MKFATEAIHSSYDCDEHNRAIMPPIYQNSMFAMHEIGEQIPYRYSRLANPTRKVLEDTMALTWCLPTSPSRTISMPFWRRKK